MKRKNSKYLNGEYIYEYGKFNEKQFKATQSDNKITNYYSNESILYRDNYTEKKIEEEGKNIYKDGKTASRIDKYSYQYELGSEEEKQNVLLGEHAASCCDAAILVGKTNSERIKRGLLNAGFDEEKIYCVKTLSDAFAVTREIKGDKKLALLLNDLPDNYL